MLPQLTPIKLGYHTIKGFVAPKHVRSYQQIYLDTLYNDEAPDYAAIAAPVRHSKTWTFVWLGLAAYLLNHPERRVLYIAYEKLSAEYGRLIRATLEGYGPRLTGVGIDNSNRSYTDFRTALGGGLTCVSAGNPIAGLGYSVIVVDDIQSKQDKLDSKNERDKNWRYFYSDAKTRLTPSGKMFVLLARRHPDDLLGRLKELTEMGDLPQSERWSFNEFHAILDDGTALWDDGSSECWPLQKLLDKQKGYELSGQSYLWSCLFQQDPMTSPQGLEWHAGLFENITIDNLPDGLTFNNQVISLDPSKGRDQKKGDYAAMGHLAEGSDGVFYLLDSRLVRQPGPELEDTYIAYAKEHEHDGNVIEANLDGGSMAEMICRRLTLEHKRLDLANKVHSVAVEIKKDKYERNRRILSLILCQGRLKFLKVGHWRLVDSQFKNFGPDSKDHDDGVDMVSQGVMELTMLATGGKYS